MLDYAVLRSKSGYGDIIYIPQISLLVKHKDIERYRQSSELIKQLYISNSRKITFSVPTLYELTAILPILRRNSNAYLPTYIRKFENWLLFNSNVYREEYACCQDVKSYYNDNIWMLRCSKWTKHKGNSSEDSIYRFALAEGFDVIDMCINGKDSRKKIEQSVTNSATNNRQKKNQDKKMVNNEQVNDELEKNLLNCDKYRCRLPIYEKTILTDIQQGHWDLFEQDSSKGKYESRDPHKDIKQGVVGIDFGTKSTVVMRQGNTDDIIPIRIGTVELDKAIDESKDYENPTIIECTNLDKFIKEYMSSEGRPKTSCEDVFISYDALNNFNAAGEHFYAYFSKLKQWAYNKNGIDIVDKKDKRYILKETTEASNDKKSLNPLEVYAYYIGMCINNMRNGIYMNYLMSFPVGYSKEAKEFIRHSFELGIKKSLPKTIVNDEECMKKFNVKLGISEPAAYAVTAMLSSDEFDPADETEKYMYGIFDFGGGTADFDFGVWRGASEDEYDDCGYEYVLDCFGADSDVTLGGENILEMLAYHVFRTNMDVVRSKKLVLTLPEGEKEFIGSEMFLENSQVAYRNMVQLKEKLRPLWHQEDGWEKKYSNTSDDDENDKRAFNNGQSITPVMYDRDGKQAQDCKFIINSDELIELIKQRIKKGIEAFFACLYKSLNGREEAKVADTKVYIILAGNSSKSVFVKELFREKIKEMQEQFKKNVPQLDQDVFELVMLENKSIDANRDDSEYVPNAKTGVAYGLVKSRAGGPVHVLKNYQTDANAEARFKYYLGKRGRKGDFNCVLSPITTQYNKWVRFQGAGNSVIPIYYTTNPVADVEQQKLSIKGIASHEFEIETMNGGSFFIRTVEPNVIEYVVAVSEDAIKESNIERYTFED